MDNCVSQLPRVLSRVTTFYVCIFILVYIGLYYTCFKRKKKE